MRRYLASLQQKRRAEQDKLGSEALRKQQEAAAIAAAQLLASNASPTAAQSPPGATVALQAATGQRRVLEAPPARPIPGLRLNPPAAPSSGTSSPTPVLSPTAAATAAAAAAATGSSGKFGSKETLRKSAASPAPVDASSRGDSSAATKSASSLTNNRSALPNRPTTSASSMEAVNGKAQPVQSKSPSSPGANVATQSLTKIDDFVPEEDSSPTAFNDFLEDATSASATGGRAGSSALGAEGGESDEEDRAPVVLGYQEEVDSEDEKRLQNARASIENPFESSNAPAADDLANGSPDADAPSGALGSSERPLSGASSPAESRQRTHSIENQDNPLVEREEDSPEAPAAAATASDTGTSTNSAAAPALVFNDAELDLLESFGTPTPASIPQAAALRSDSDATSNNTPSESRGPSKKKHSSSSSKKKQLPVSAEADSDETSRERKHKHKKNSAAEKDSVTKENSSSSSSKSNADRSKKQAPAIIEEPSRSAPAAKSRSSGGLKQSHEQPASAAPVSKRAGATAASAGLELADEGELDALEAFLDDGPPKPATATRPTKTSSSKSKKQSKRAQIQEPDNENSD